MECLLIDDAPEMSRSAVRRIERESGANFLSDGRPPVVLGHKLQGHTPWFPLGRLVLDAQVRNGDLFSDHPKAVAPGNLRARVGTEMGDVAIDFPLKLVTEDDAEGPASFLLNPRRFSLIKDIQIGIVVGVPEFDEAVVDRLIFGNQVSGTHQLVPPLGQGPEFPGSGFGAFEGAFAHQTLSPEIPEFSGRLFRTAAVNIEPKVVRGNHSKPAEFGQGANFRIVEAVAAVAVNLSGITRNDFRATVYGPAIDPLFRRRRSAHRASGFGVAVLGLGRPILGLDTDFANVPR